MKTEGSFISRLKEEHPESQASSSNISLLLEARTTFEREPSLKLQVFLRALESVIEEEIQEEGGQGLTAFVKSNLSWYEAEIEKLERPFYEKPTKEQFLLLKGMKAAQIEEKQVAAKCLNSSWDLYDALIDGIPSDLTVDECIIGLNWTFVRSGDLAGIAMTCQGSSATGLANGSHIGRSLRDVAYGLKSWDMLQASVGMAACNAWYNSPNKMHSYGLGQGIPQEGAGESIFNEPLESFEGKKVAVVGHFPLVEKQLGRKCSLSILEREPEGADFLDSACEYILPEQDFVFITGMTLTNKTLPRLLSLCRHAKTTLVGPSATISPILFDFGVDCIAGFYITDIDLTRSMVSQAAHREIFRSGKRITLSKEELPKRT